jgi:opacity protein-like surface antigen
VKKLIFAALTAVLISSSAPAADWFLSDETKKALDGYPKAQAEVTELDQRTKDLDQRTKDLEQHQTLLMASLAFAVLGIGIAYGVGFASGVKARAGVKT